MASHAFQPWKNTTFGVEPVDTINERSDFDCFKSDKNLNHTRQPFYYQVSVPNFLL